MCLTGRASAQDGNEVADGTPRSSLGLGDTEPYHDLKSTRALATTHQTHVAVEGLVLDVMKEEDGDVHVRLSDGTVSKCDVAAYMAAKCVVAEIRPKDLETVEPPRKGERVKVYGISRYDRVHHWWEIHPVDRLDVVACADNRELPCR